PLGGTSVPRVGAARPPAREPRGDQEEGRPRRPARVRAPGLEDDVAEAGRAGRTRAGAARGDAADALPRAVRGDRTPEELARQIDVAPRLHRAALAGAADVRRRGAPAVAGRSDAR